MKAIKCVDVGCLMVNTPGCAFQRRHRPADRLSHEKSLLYADHKLQRSGHRSGADNQQEQRSRHLHQGRRTGRRTDYRCFVSCPRDWLIYYNKYIDCHLRTGTRTFADRKILANKRSPIQIFTIDCIRIVHNKNQ